MGNPSLTRPAKSTTEKTLEFICKNVLSVAYIVLNYIIAFEI